MRFFRNIKRIITRRPSLEKDVNDLNHFNNYCGLHEKMRKIKRKPKLCSCKKRPPSELHNISGEYKRDLSDWVWLCKSCHSRTRPRSLNKKIKLFEL